MASNPSRSDRGRLGSGSSIPRIELVRIDHRGAVLKCDRAYETGDSLAIGVQVSPVPISAWPSPQPGFVDVEGFVVDCRRIRLPNAELSYEVTLLFGELSDAETILLDGATLAPHSPHHWPTSPWSLN